MSFLEIGDCCSTVLQLEDDELDLLVVVVVWFNVALDLVCALTSNDSGLPQVLFGSTLVGPDACGRLVPGAGDRLLVAADAAGVGVKVGLKPARERRSRSLGGEGDRSANEELDFEFFDSGWLIISFLTVGESLRADLLPLSWFLVNGMIALLFCF